MVCVLVLLFLMSLGRGGMAYSQSPDPAGWMASEIQAPIPSEATELSNDIRSQIGLATYIEPIPATTSAEPEAANSSALKTSQLNPFSPAIVATLPATNEAPVPGDTATSTQSGFAELLSSQTEQLTSSDGLQSSIKVALLLATLSLAPAIMLMTTCYIRVVVVLTLLKQAFGGQQLPPTQVLTALSLFLTFLVMTPVWNEIKTEAINPYTRDQNPISWDEALQRGVMPVRNFMIRQIEMADNTESVAVFYKYLPDAAETPPTEMADVPLNVLLPAFMISELKVAFLLGFQVFLPFLVLDLIVSSVTVSMGMLMLPPNMVSFPLKLILFVMVDGWNLVVGMLLQSFGS